MIDIKELSIIPLTVHDYNTNNDQIKKLKKNEILISLSIIGFKIVLDDSREIILPKYKYSMVFQYITKEGNNQIIEYVKRLSTFLAFCYRHPITHVFIIYNKYDNSYFPISAYTYNETNQKIAMLLTAQKEKNIKEYWENKKKLFIFMADKFLKLDKEALPFLWYGRSILINEHLLRFLNLYRVIELLAHDYAKKIEEEIRNAFWKPLSIESKHQRIRKYYKMIGFPLKERVPFFLESHGISKQKIKIWKELRNSITHGNLYLENDKKFNKELSIIDDFVYKILLGKIHNEYGFI